MLVARLEALELPGETFHLLFAGLLTASLVRDLPEKLQADPRVQAALEERLVGVGAAALWLRDLFSETPAARFAEVAQKLRSDPGFVEDLKAAMEPWFGPDAVEPERRGQVYKALDQLRWDLTEGDPAEVYAEQVRQIDRFERMSARMLARQDAGGASAGGASAGETSAGEALPAGGGSATLEGEDPCGDLIGRYPGPGDDPPEGMPRRVWRREWYRATRNACLLPEGGYDPRFRAIHRWRNARQCAIVGAALTGLGLVTLPILVGICILTPAVVLLLTALLLVLAARAAEDAVPQGAAL